MSTFGATANSDFAPNVTGLSTANGVGAFMGFGTANGSAVQIVRGGSISDGTNTGIFAARNAGPVVTVPTTVGAGTVNFIAGVPGAGFRCSYTP